MKYTAEMIDFLREKVRETSDRAEITRLFNERFGTDKTEGAITQAMFYRNLCEKRDDKYTPKMMDYLCRNANSFETRAELVRHFNERFGTNKTLSGIQQALCRRGISADVFFTKEMDKFIIDNRELTYSELSQAFNRRFGTQKTKEHIGGRYRKLGLVCSREIKSRANRKYKQEMIEFIRDNLQRATSRRELTQLFNARFNENKDVYSIRSLINRYNLDQNKRTFFTKEMENFLRENVSPNISYEQLRKMFNEKFGEKRTLSSIQRKCDSLGIDCGSKGNTSRTRKIGSEVVRPQGVYIKGEDGKWRLKQSVLCDSRAGERILFYDKNHGNFSPDNVEKVTRGEFQALVRLGMYSEEPEVTKAGILFVRLTRRLKELQKKRKG